MQLLCPKTWIYSATFLIYLEISSILAGVTSPNRVRRQAALITCINPNFDVGYCVPTEKCEPLNNLLSTSSRLEETQKEFLQKSRCSAEDEDVKVCCPDNKDVSVRYSYTSYNRRKTPVKGATNTAAQPAKAGQTGGSTRKSSTSVPKFPSSCGKSSLLTPKVQGGDFAKLGDFPWAVALYYYNTRSQVNEASCGGTLISDEWVLTAAHCLHGTPFQLSSVKLGDLNLNDAVSDGATPVTMEVSETIVHPKYYDNPIINDIALIRMKNKVTFNKNLSPACMPTLADFKKDSFYEKKTPFVAGWGYSNELLRERSTELKYAQIPYTKTNVCKEKYKYIMKAQIDENVICAGNSQKDACGGDSGGPIMVYHNNMYYVAGIVSYGAFCGQTHNLTGVYTRLANYMDWVKNTTGLTA